MEIKLENFYRVIDKKHVYTKNKRYIEYTLNKNILSDSDNLILFKHSINSFYTSTYPNKIYTSYWTNYININDYVFLKKVECYYPFIELLENKELWWNFLSSLKDNEIDENLMDFINSVLCY